MEARELGGGRKGGGRRAVGKEGRKCQKKRKRKIEVVRRKGK